MTHSPEILRLDHVTKLFGQFAAADDITLSVEAGEVVGFVGVNGAGKTTTINMILGFTSPSKGSVTVFSRKVLPATAHQSHRRIGYAAGDMELPDRMTGRQYIAFVLGQTSMDHTKRLDELQKVFKPQLDKKISTLSRGNKQKIALLAAFVVEPELVVLDEPTSGLDPIMQEAFLGLVREEQAKGTTIFMSSHYLQEVAEVCNRVLLMKNGRVVEDLSAKQLAQTGGKVVKVVSSGIITVPTKHVKNVTHEHPKHGLITTFVYDGPMANLQKWIADLKGVKDIDISQRTLEAEFRSLYDETEKRS
ncbi:ABC transporter ATP-binding protein [bacterium]|nr:MAG: ABC transporter ATP-binding protein [bacterium]